MHSRVLTEVFELCLAEFLGRSLILELQAATKRKLHFIVQYLKPVPFRIEKTLQMDIINDSIEQKN